MVNVGDRIVLSSLKGPNREGVVTAVTGAMVRVRWSSGQESSVVPGPGTLTVRESAPDQAHSASSAGAASSGTSSSRQPAKKTAATKGATNKTAPKKASNTAAPTKPDRRKGTTTSTKAAKRPS